MATMMVAKDVNWLLLSDLVAIYFLKFELKA